jgi:hypothetical protein
MRILIDIQGETIASRWLLLQIIGIYVMGFVIAVLTETVDPDLRIKQFVIRFYFAGGSWLVIHLISKVLGRLADTGD